MGMRYKICDYDILHKFYEPAIEQYKLAVSKDPNCCSVAEIDNVRNAFEYYKYLENVQSCETEEEYINMLSLIEGYECLEDFSFHDSQLIKFEYNENHALLELKYRDVYCFEFDDIYDMIQLRLM